MNIRSLIPAVAIHDIKNNDPKHKETNQDALEVAKPERER